MRRWQLPFQQGELPCFTVHFSFKGRITCSILMQETSVVPVCIPAVLWLHIHCAQRIHAGSIHTLEGRSTVPNTEIETVTAIVMPKTHNKLGVGRYLGMHSNSFEVDDTCMIRWCTAKCVEHKEKGHTMKGQMVIVNYLCTFSLIVRKPCLGYLRHNA